MTRPATTRPPPAARPTARPADGGGPVWQDRLGDLDTFEGGRPTEPPPGSRTGTFSEPDFRVPSDTGR